MQILCNSFIPNPEVHNLPLNVETYTDVTQTCIKNMWLSFSILGGWNEPLFYGKQCPVVSPYKGPGMRSFGISLLLASVLLVIPNALTPMRTDCSECLR